MFGVDIWDIQVEISSGGRFSEDFLECIFVSLKDWGTIGGVFGGVPWNCSSSG